MNTTWKELQETCLRKIFSLDGDELTQDSATLPYLNAMPAAANEALLLLATTGRYWKKVLTIEQGTEAATEPDMVLGSLNAYDLRKAAEDFYCIDSMKLANGEGYGLFEGYEMEGEHLLLLPVGQTGTFRIWYNAYPEKITKDTPDDHVIQMHPEAVSLVAHYMAGQLYKDDDISIAQIWMNEFLTWLEELKATAKRAAGKNANSGGGWKSSKGWY
jgi:hypothetical protein